MTIRAKFRCLSIENKWNGETIVKMGPVKRDGKDKENQFFWKYTPSGSVEIQYLKGAATPFKPGDYYFIDMSQSDVGAWRIRELSSTDYGAKIEMTCGQEKALGCLWGCLQMQLSQEAEGARAGLQPHGSRWDVRFTFAEGSDY